MLLSEFKQTTAAHVLRKKNIVHVDALPVTDGVSARFKEVAGEFAARFFGDGTVHVHEVHSMLSLAEIMIAHTLFFGVLVALVIARGFRVSR